MIPSPPPPRSSPALPAWLALSLLFACSSPTTGEGELSVFAYGEPFIEDGIPAAEMADGWAVRFDHFAHVDGEGHCDVRGD